MGNISLLELQNQQDFLKDDEKIYHLKKYILQIFFFIYKLNHNYNNYILL